MQVLTNHRNAPEYDLRAPDATDARFGFHGPGIWCQDDIGFLDLRVEGDELGAQFIPTG